MLPYFLNIRKGNRLCRKNELDFGTLFIKARWHYQSSLLSDESHLDRSFTRNPKAK
jgi:hypothetical protein